MVVEVDEVWKREVLVKLDSILANLRIKGEHWRVTRVERLRERIQKTW